MSKVNREGQYYREYGRNEYEYGNAARALRNLHYENPDTLKVTHHAGKSRRRKTKATPAFIFFLSIAIVITAAVCIQYLVLQSKVTSQIKEISALEIQLNNLKAENDDTESRIKGAIDLEEIKLKAMNELGMQYAREDQIVNYSSDDTDYVRQYIDIQ